MANVPAASIALCLLGSFELRAGDRNTKPALDRKTRAILAYLAATGQAHSRQALYSLFCQEAADPPGTLRWHLSRIRRLLSPTIITATKETIQLNRKTIWIDCSIFQAVVDHYPISASLQELTIALDLYRGDFLEGTALSDAPEFELWLLGERARLRQLYERGLAEIVERLIAADRYETAIQRAQQLVQSNPLREEAHARLAWLYAHTGQRAAALHQFERCRDLLRDELAVDPAPEFVRLHGQIRAGEIGRTQLLPASRPIELQKASDRTATLVGREAELIQLYQAWHTAQRQGGAIVLVEAEAGGGKTRLAQEFGRSLPGALFLTGQCYESTRTVPYRPWIDILQARLAQVGRQALARLSPYWLDQLVRLLPELAPQRKASQLAAALPTSGEQEHLWMAVAEALFGLPPPDSQAPGGQALCFVLFVDDLQWADEASLRLFHFIAHRLRRQSGAPALLLGAFRGEEADDNPALLTLLRDLRRSGPLVSLALQPLAAPAVNALIADLWPELPPGYRMPHIRDLLLKETNGNPLFATELVRELADSTALPTPLPVPPSLRELIERRLHQLNPSGRQVIEALAVLDTPATLALAQQCSGRSADETTNAIDLGLRWRLLRSVAGSPPAQFEFGHALMREAVAIQLSDVRRQRLHQRAAAALEQRGAPAAMLAYHWGRAGDNMKEEQYAALAGQAAATVFANDEAIRYLQRALELAAEPQQRLDLMNRLGDVKSLTGKWTEAEAIFREVLVIAEQIGDVPAQVQASIQLAQLKFRQGDQTEALQVFERAQLYCETASNQAGLCEVLSGKGMILLQRGQVMEALAHFEQWLQIGHATGDRRAISRAMGRMGVAYVHLADSQRALRCFEQQLQIASELGDQLTVGNALGNLANIYHVELFDYRRAWDYRQQEIHVWSEIGFSQGLTWAIGNLTELYLDLGDYASVLACGQRHLQLCIDLGERLGITLALGRMAHTFAEQGQPAKAERLLRQELALGRLLHIPYYLCYALGNGAQLYFQQQDYAHARQLNDEALDVAKQAKRTQVEFSALLLSIKLRLALHEIDVATATRAFEALLVAWPAEPEQAALHYELGRLQPDPALSRQHTHAAVQLYQRLYERTRWVSDRRRYEELAGDVLPDPPSLPAPPSIARSDRVDLSALLAQVDTIIAELAA